MNDYLKAFKQSNAANSFPLEFTKETISKKDLKSFVLEAVVKFMNEEDLPISYEKKEPQKLFDHLEGHAFKLLKEAKLSRVITARLSPGEDPDMPLLIASYIENGIHIADFTYDVFVEEDHVRVGMLPHDIDFALKHKDKNQIIELVSQAVHRVNPSVLDWMDVTVIYNQAVD